MGALEVGLRVVVFHIPHEMVGRLVDDRWDGVAVDSAGDWRRRYLSPTRRLELQQGCCRGSQLASVR